MARVLADRYELVSVVGRGPHGEVWSARDRRTRDRLAVKLLDQHITAEAGVMDRFNREKSVLKAFVHPAFVRVRDMFIDEGTLALVTELVEGEDLRRTLDQSGPLPLASVVEIGRLMAEALAAAHATGIVHCDLKPTNILMTAPGGDARLSDCRVARLARGSPNGIPAPGYAASGYAAPELAQGGTPVPASDVHALGAVLLEMITSSPQRQRDADGRLLRQWGYQPKLRQLLLLVDECMSADPTARPAAEELAEQLRDLAGSLRTAGGAADLERGPDLPDTARTNVARPPLRSATQASGRNPRRPLRAVLAATIAIVVAGATLLVLRGLAATVGGPQAVIPNSSAQSEAAGPLPSTSSTVAQAAPAGTPLLVESAIAFVRDWFGSLNAAVATGATASLEAASSPGCKACNDAVATLKAAYSDNGALRGGAYAIREMSADSFFTTERPSLHVVFDRSTRSSVDATGNIGEILPGGTFLTCHVILERADNQWRMLEVLSTERMV